MRLRLYQPLMIIDCGVLQISATQTNNNLLVSWMAIEFISSLLFIYCMYLSLLFCFCIIVSLAETKKS